MTDKKRINTVWMWQDGIYTRGVNLDVKKGALVWQDDMTGFGCIVFPDGQPIDDFLENGPERYATPPEDIRQEIREAIDALREA
jgi:hypothetical protein